MRAMMAAVDPTPAVVLRRLDEIEAEAGPGMVATVLYAVVDTTTCCLTLARAGHLPLALAEASISVLTVFAIFWVGRMAGGTGQFKDAIITVIWLQFVLLIVEIGVLFFGVFAPMMATLLWIMGGTLGFWLLTHFITEMHEFRSPGMVFLGIILTIFAVVVMMSVVLAMIGIGADTRPGEF